MERTATTATKGRTATLVKRRTAVLVMATGVAALAAGLLSVPAQAAAGATLSRTSGPLGTTIKVSGACTDLMDSSKVTAKIKLYYPDAYDAPFSSFSEFHSVSVTASSTTGAFSGSIKVGPAVKYTKAGPGPAMPGAEVLRKPKAGDVIKVQVQCNQLASPYPISFVAGTKSFTVTKSTFTLKKRPTATGKAKVGKKLTATKGTWSPSPTSYAYQWKRGTKAISGATKRTYTLKARDEGEKVSVVVKAKRTGYVTKSATSTKRLIAPSTSSPRKPSSDRRGPRRGQGSRTGG